MDPITLSLTKRFVDNRLSQVATPRPVSRNLFNKDDVEIGKYIRSSDGAIMKGPSASGINAVSGFIPVPGGGGVYHSTYATLAFYDADKRWISGAPGGGPRFRAVPMNARYIRISFIPEDIDLLQLEEGVFPTDYTPYSEALVIHAPVNVSNLEGAKLGKNLFDKTAAVQGAYYRKTDGKLVLGESATGVNYYSNAMRLEPGQTYYRNKWSTVVFFDENGEFIGSVDTGIGSFVVPEGTVYARVNGRYNEIDTMQVEKGEHPTTYEPFGYGSPTCACPALGPGFGGGLLQQSW